MVGLFSGAMLVFREGIVWFDSYDSLWFYDSARHRKDEEYIADMFKAEAVKGQVDISTMLNEKLYGLGAA